MNELLSVVEEYLASPQVAAALRVVLILVAGFLAARLGLHLVTLRSLHPQHRLVLQKVVKYAVVGLALTWALQVMGVSLSVLVGAAGLLTVALGFAAQTSASNLISGLFLMGEQPFVIGDFIRVGETTGEEVAGRNPICLEEPEPLIIFLGFGDSSLDFQFSVWCAKDNIISLRNTMHEEVKAALDARGIEIPFPHRTLYAGSVSAPFPVRLVEPDADAEDSPPSA